MKGNKRREACGPPPSRDPECWPGAFQAMHPFAPVDLLAGIITARAASGFSVVLMLWLSMIAAEETGFAPDPLAIRLSPAHG